MRRLFLLIIVPFLLFTGLQAQTTQVEADDLVLEKMSGETRPYTIYAKEDIQPAGTVLTTSAGEIMVFEYEHWLYYVSFTENSQNNFYFVIKESNGSLLEVNTKNDDEPNDLKTWRLLFKPDDALIGEWTWIKTIGGFWGGETPNEFKCVIKILSENEDSSVNYEVFVEDTLYYNGSFQVIGTLWDYKIVNIHLPHGMFHLLNRWGLFFINLDTGATNKNTLGFWDCVMDGYFYYYQKREE